MALSDEIAERLLTSIIDGHYPPGTLLPVEDELAQEYSASRLTLREAVKVLRSQNIVRIHRGRGTYVNAPDQWTALEPMIRAEARRPGGTVSEKLIEARELIEAGSARLAAVRRTEDDLTELAELLEEMKETAGAGDTDAFVDADIAFHQVIMRASGNAFVPLLFQPFGRLLVDGRRETSAVPQIRENAIAHHQKVLDALRAGDPEQARQAMEGHMAQTADDLRTHVLKSDG
ncbi:FadR/GntR family transcriptional regulator [Streptomyces purpurogeneiscleroticus]|uniref:FadR/GntR family transcriptional regulator n=1 Tax=Streptomyces purpurogeneiscleroticus TaxID=68259 RepID=UPI001CBAFB1D|nr:FadR/GntR family transcriptional regulator [Streptomyces purpurogeneiscleroticus]MBZ4014747.1 GntR family transcriptional regulator [Streptomyces purpurogeneiscleroticus]